VAQGKKQGVKRKRVRALTHDEATRKNIPTVEYQPVMQREEQSPVRVAYERRNPDLDPQLVWRGKDAQDRSDLMVQVPPLYIQEKVHPKALIDDLRRQTEMAEADVKSDESGYTGDLFADFNGLPDGAASTEFYRHDANWSNRMILGDSLQVMASLAEREGLRGKVQCIYLDPPYGIKFNSNFQWSTTSREVKDGNAAHITREPEQVKAFRDTWRDGVHSYLTYLRDRLTIARDLLSESGSIFVQIGDENVHRVRGVMDEIFGEENFKSQITCRVSSGTTRERTVKRVADYLLWCGKDGEQTKFRRLLQRREIETKTYGQVEEVSGLRRPMTMEEKQDTSTLPSGAKVFQKLPLHSMASGDNDPRVCFGVEWKIPSMRSWRHSPLGFQRLLAANRVYPDKTALRSVYFHSDYPAAELNNVWTDTGPEISKSYVVQTSTRIIQRCILMSTDPGDLILDPTCGAGTTAYVAEEWGRRWITIDTSRVSLALARARIMGARFPYYLLADSAVGQQREAEATCSVPSTQPIRNDIRQGFVYERVPHITLKSIAKNAEIDVIWAKFQEMLEPLRLQLNEVLGQSWEEWEIPRELDESWTEAAKQLHEHYHEHRVARQREIDSSIAVRADFEYLYDSPYEDRTIVRVSGSFTVESLSPHRVLGIGDEDDLIDPTVDLGVLDSDRADFAQLILENLRTAGVQQVHKEDRIAFTSLNPWPGKELICAEGRYIEGDSESLKNGTGFEKRAAIFIGPEFGTVSRPDLAAAAREAGEADFDVLIACAFNYDAHSSDLDRLGRIPVLKARINADLHMAEELKATGKGNLFVVFGEPDIEVIDGKEGQMQVKVKGVDVFHPQTGEVRSDGPEGIACWFIDTDYNEESFFVRQAYFLGANDPYKSLRTTLKAEINREAWETLHSNISRPFDRPGSGRIAVKVINHLGDEVMKVFRVKLGEFST